MHAPQLTGLALALGSMVGGALIAEMILQLPGPRYGHPHGDPGQRLSSHHRVHVAHYGVVLIANFTVDILVGLLDPRIRAAKTGSQ